MTDNLTDYAQWRRAQPEPLKRTTGYVPGFDRDADDRLLAAAEAPSPFGYQRRFRPVVVRERHDGWSADKQVAFVAALGEGGCVADAARAVGMSTESAYKLRARPDATDFRMAWQAALDYAVQRLEDAVLSRAINGVAVPQFYKGEIIGERRRYDERLALFLLRYRRPLTYARHWDRQAVVAGHPEDEAERFAAGLHVVARDLTRASLEEDHAARAEAMAVAAEALAATAATRAARAAAVPRQANDDDDVDDDDVDGLASGGFDSNSRDAIGFAGSPDADRCAAAELEAEILAAEAVALRAAAGDAAAVVAATLRPGAEHYARWVMRGGDVARPSSTSGGDARGDGRGGDGGERRGSGERPGGRSDDGNRRQRRAARAAARRRTHAAKAPAM